MNLINLKVNPSFYLPIHLILISITLCFILTTSCSEKETVGFQFCDNFNDSLDCTEPKTENDLVVLDKSKFKKENPSYEDFGNFLYFTARETPGFRLVLSKPWNGENAVNFRSGYKAYLLYGSAKERMEGNLFQPNTIVSFHYLGALLKEEFRHLGIAEKPFQLESLGTITLTYLVEVPGFPPITKQRSIQLLWK
ncbi:hypothetical protein AB3N60_08495 [Leptospira sp. WS39.C2]